MTDRITRLTNGPQFHWFGYYDKFETDPSDRFVLAMQVDFEHRSPTADDTIKVGLIDLDDNNRWTELGESSAWCWQQGCMLQWLPGDAHRIIWNDLQRDRFVCHIVDINTGARNTLPFPVYSVSSDGKSAVSPDFRRIQDMRPGYGYPGLPDPHGDELAPDQSGIWRGDLSTGKREFIIAIKQVVDIERNPTFDHVKHYFNHLLVNPDDSRFVFLHRYRLPGKHNLTTRMLTANLDGSEIRLVNDANLISHFIWRDSQSILMYTRPDPEDGKFYVYNELTGDRELAMDIPNDGHCSYFPDKARILCDCYPHGGSRDQELYIYNTTTQQRHDLGPLFSPPEYTGEWRCDLHPRLSRKGDFILVDSVHEGLGRQLYKIDLG